MLSLSAEFSGGTLILYYWFSLNKFKQSRDEFCQLEIAAKVSVFGGTFPSSCAEVQVSMNSRALTKCVILYLKVPIVLPALMVLMSAYLVIAPIIDQPSMEYLYCVIFIFSGLILYFIFIYRKVKWARKVTGKRFQQLTNSCRNFIIRCNAAVQCLSLLQDRSPPICSWWWRWFHLRRSIRTRIKLPTLAACDELN